MEVPKDDAAVVSSNDGVKWKEKRSFSFLFSFILFSHYFSSIFPPILSSLFFLSFHFCLTN